jgi:hypothetical protein
MKHLFTVLFLALAILPASARAQAPPTKAFSGYAVRFQIRDDLASYEPILGAELESHFSAPLFMSRATPPTYNSKIAMIHLYAKREGEAWNVSVRVTLPKDGGERVLAVGRLREGDKLRVDKFTDYDLRASEISIVKIDPVDVEPPLIANLTSSIEVSKIDTSVVPAPYIILLKNIASKPVEALEVTLYRGNGSKLSIAYPEGHWGDPLMKPDATYRFSMETSADYKPIAPNEYRPTQTRTIEITTVVFADGTFEGKPGRAEWSVSQTIGNRLQLDRTLSLMANVLGSGELNTAQAPVDFRLALLAMSSDADKSYTEEVRTRFPMFDEATLKNVDEHVRWGLEQVRAFVLADLRQAATGSEAASFSFSEWLIKEQEKCKAWRARVS